MKVAKLSDGSIVQYLKPPQDVAFAAGKHVLVAGRLTTRQRRIDPFWVPAVAVVWVLDFGDTM